MNKLLRKHCEFKTSASKRDTRQGPVMPLWIGLGLALLSLGPTRLNAATYYVATNGLDTRTGLGDWTNAVATISNAVAKATTAGDVVLLSNGTYVLTQANIYITNGITIKGYFGRETTIVDGNYPTFATNCFLLNHGGAVLDNLTVSNGYYDVGGSYGGGISLQQGSVTNCVITKCRGVYGGGIGVAGSWTGTVANCVITYNTAAAGGGIGSGSVATTGTIHHCIVYGNTASRGGGIRLRGSLIDNCIFSNNIATSTSGGGGMETVGAPPITEYRNCLFTQNQATNAGGTGGGGSIGAANSVRMLNCTIVSNYARGHGGGLYVVGDSTLTNSYVNCIIYSNDAISDATTKDISLDVATSTTDRFANCCARYIGSYSSVKYLPTSQGNITNNPAFVDGNTGNYRLQIGSPCINTGTNADWMSAATDLAGQPRLRYQRVDIGSYECFINRKINGVPIDRCKTINGVPIDALKMLNGVRFQP